MFFQDRVQEVFEKELLLDNILKYVIQGDDDSDEISYANVRCCRLVSKAWSHSITRILRKCRKPVFHLRLDKENSLSKSTLVFQNGKRLDNFVSSVSGTSPLPNQIPTFSLTIKKDFFRQENYDSLLRCLSHCGSSLVDLDIYFPGNGGSLTFLFPHLQFPNLKSLNMSFEQDAQMELEEGEAMVGISNGVYFLQLLLSGCKDLQSLYMGWLANDFPIPYGIDHLSLPATLTSLWLNFDVSENKLYDLFVRNQFPKLKKLLFVIGSTPLIHGEIFKILDNVKTLLTDLSIYTVDIEDTQTYIRLPLMENLKSFKTISYGLELEDGVSMLQNYIPNIRRLSLEGQTTTMFRKWTESSKYDSVRELTAGLVSENDRRDVGFPLEMMRLVETAFPNIQTLEITVCGTDLSGLKHAFQYLQTLQSLEVYVDECENIVNSDCWDSLLIGTPVEFATALKTTREFWNDVKFGPNIDHQSIKNLTELRKLQLVAYVWPVHSPLKEIPLISEVAFHFAFLNMPKLKQLNLSDRFMVSSELMELWRDQFSGRCINKW